MSNVLALPTAAVSYIEVRQVGKRWAIDLVTPVEGQKALRTQFARADLFTHALEFGRKTAATKKRRLKLPEGWE